MTFGLHEKLHTNMYTQVKHTHSSGGGGVADGEMRLELVKGGSLGTVPQNLPPSSE